jgi:hypothetical protein
MIVSFAVGGAEWLLMVLVSGYGALMLPATARIPLHWAGTYSNFTSKRTGLVVWPAAGAGLLVLLIVASGLTPHGKPAGSLIEVLLPIVMGVLLVAQAGGIVTARRRSGRAA